MSLLHREAIINYLAEIAMGDLSLSLEQIEQESNTETRELLFGLLCLHEDLMLQRQEVATLNTFLQNILQSFSELLFIINDNGQIQMINKQSRDSIQRPQFDIQHQHIGQFLTPLQGSDTQMSGIFDKIDFPYARIVTLIKAQRFTEIPMMLRSELEDFPVLVTGHLMESAPNISANVIFSAKDGRQSRLLQELQEKHLQLVQASKLASMGELSSGIAHELNNPLFAIAGLTEVMQRRLRKEHPEAYECVSKSFDTMLIATEKMRSIINHIRIFARQEHMHFYPHPINKIIDTSLLLIQQQFRRQSIDIELNLSIKNPLVMCAPNRLEQVIINLMSNARDAIESKRLQTSDFSGQIEIFTHQKADKVIVKVRDNGIGIDAEGAKRLYDPFYSTKEVGKGTGLGLSISYGIIQEHHGSIEMKSTIGQFTEFTLTFDAVSTA